MNGVADAVGGPGRSGPPRVLWQGVLDDQSGLARVGRSLLWRLAQRGVDISVTPASVHRIAVPTRLGDWSLERRMDRALMARMGSSRGPRLAIHHLPLVAELGRIPLADRHVLYTVFELDGVPARLLALAGTFSDVWVPSTFCRTVLIEAGLDAERVAVIPHGVGGEWHAVAQRRAARVATSAPGFVVLSVFLWEHRKGPDVLMRAARRAFDGDPSVLVRIVTGPRQGDPRTGTWDAVRREFAAATQGSAGPRFELVESGIDDAALLAEYERADVFVLPTRGEGFGLPVLDALAAGLPTVATDWSGIRDFLTAETGEPIPVCRRSAPAEGLVVPYGESLRGFCLGEPDEDVLVATLRRLRADPAEATRRAVENAPKLQDAWSWDRAASIALARIHQCIERSPAAATHSRAPASSWSSGRLSLRLEGAFFANHSLARVNRELGAALIATGAAEIALTQTEPDELTSAVAPRWSELEAQTRQRPRAVDVCIRHGFPPTLDPAVAARHTVLCQPWEYGHLPVAWVEALRTGAADALWVPSTAVRTMALRSGLSEAQVHVVPNGVSLDQYHPNIPPLDHLPTRRACRFLFVGNGMARKGVDVLLDAYEAAFDVGDDVSLLMKLSKAGGRYDLGDAMRQIEAVRGRRRAPEVRVTDAELSESELASLYRSVTCLVAPYRGEGFALPVLEAMACGTPVIVTAGGSTDDFVTDSCGLRVPAAEVPLPITIASPLRLCGPGYWLEPDREALVESLRSIYENEGAVREWGLAAARAATGHTWAVAAQAALAAANQLVSRS